MGNCIVEDGEDSDPRSSTGVATDKPRLPSLRGRSSLSSVSTSSSTGVTGVVMLSRDFDLEPFDAAFLRPPSRGLNGLSRSVAFFFRLDDRLSDNSPGPGVSDFRLIVFRALRAGTINSMFGVVVPVPLGLSSNHRRIGSSSYLAQFN